MKYPLTLCVLTIALPLAAQKVELQAGSQKEPLRYTIETKLKVESQRKVLINGEERDFGGRGGGGASGPQTIEQKIVFVEGPRAEGWRHYQVLEAVDTSTGPDGEERKSEVKGALAGKKVTISRNEDGDTVFTEGEGDSAKPVPASLSRGVAARIDLSGILPGKAVEKGEEFKLGKSFRRVLASLAHPVTPERASGGGRGQGRGGRGQGGRRQGGGFGGRGGFGRGAGGGAAGQVIQIFQSTKIHFEGHGTLVGIEERDGRQIATIEIAGRLKGEGTAADLGLGRGGFGGGRGGRGGQGGGAAGEDKSTVNVDIKGLAEVDVAAGLVMTLSLEGKLKSTQDTKRTFNRDGEDWDIESSAKTTGTFVIAVGCQPAKMEKK